MTCLSRDFLLLWQGQVVSQLGNQAFLIAATYLTLETTGSSTLVATVMIASTIPLAIVSPLGGVVADRYSRRAILIVTDVLRGLLIGALGWLVSWGHGALSTHVMLLVVVATISGVLAGLFTPALQAFIPDLVAPDRLATANSVSQFSTQATVLVGQAAGGVLYVLWGAGPLLLLDALSFVYAAVATALISAGGTPVVRTPGGALRGLRKHVTDAGDGLTYVRSRTGMLTLLVVFGGVNLLFMPVFVLLPLYVGDVLGGGAEMYGFLLAASGAGALIGAVSASAMITKTQRKARLVQLCILGIAGCVALLGLTRSPGAAVLAFATIGWCSSLVNVTVLTTFQLAVPAKLRGRVIALAVAVSAAAVPIGLAVGGVVGDLWRESLKHVIVLCGTGMACVGMVAARLRGFQILLDRPDATVGRCAK
jgi:MFS family permease